MWQIIDEDMDAWSSTTIHSGAAHRAVSHSIRHIRCVCAVVSRYQKSKVAWLLSTHIEVRRGVCLEWIGGDFMVSLIFGRGADTLL